LGDPAKRRKYDATLMHPADKMGSDTKAQDTARGTGRQFWKFYAGYGAVLRIFVSDKSTGRKPEPGKHWKQKQEKPARRDRYVRGVYEYKVRRDTYGKIGKKGFANSLKIKIALGRCFR